MNFVSVRTACPVALVLAAACSKQESAPSAPLASAVTAAPAPAASMLTDYAIDVASKAAIDLEAPKEHIKADATSAAGSLRVDLAKLTNSRGEVKFDLTQLKFRTFDDEGKNASQTEHARNWLEVGALVDAPTRAGNQFVVFAIQSIEAVSEPDVSKIAPVRVGDEDVRSATLTARGDFLLHGRKVSKDVALQVAFHYAKGADAVARPLFISVKTATPMHVTLAEHDVKPLDGFGKVAQWTANLVSKVATNADVTLDLRASPR